MLSVSLSVCLSLCACVFVIKSNQYLLFTIIQCIKNKDTSALKEERDRQTDIRTDRNRERQRDRETETETQRQTETDIDCWFRMKGQTTNVTTTTITTTTNEDNSDEIQSQQKRRDLRHYNHTHKPPSACRLLTKLTGRRSDPRKCTLFRCCSGSHFAGSALPCRNGPAK